MMRFLTVILCFFISITATAQTIKGVVVSHDTGKPIKDASVFFDNTTIATTTDGNGVFEIKLATKNKNQLIITAEGYDYFIVSNPTATNSLKIALQTDEQLLEELVIDTNVFSRKEYLKAFKHFFIGTTKNAKSTKILNENDLVFYFDTKTNTFTAYSEKPIEIENSNLGYHIKFYLQLFQVTFNYKTLNPNNYINSNYFGRSLFSEKATPTKKNINNRLETYQKSAAAFFSYLTTSDLENSDYILAVNGLGVNVEEYLNVESENEDYKICVIKKPTRKKPNLSKIVFKGGTPNFLNEKDNKETKVPFVVYNKKTEQQSQLFFQNNCIVVQEKGHLLNPNDVYFSGFFADLKMGDMLPVDYDSPKIFAKKSGETSNNQKMPAYDVFEKEAIAFYTSKNFNAHRKARKTFIDKLKAEYDYKVHEPFTLWIEDNLKSTLFASKEEAITLHDNFVSTFKLIKDQKEDIEKKEDYFSKLYGEEKFGKMYYNNVIKGLFDNMVNTKKESE